MLIKRDFFDVLSRAKLEVVLLWGARQVGKTTLLDTLPLLSKAFLDDLTARSRAEEDPALFLSEIKLPCLIDEAQYAPALFSEIKLRVDAKRRQALKQTPPTSPSPLYYLTGSHRTLLDQEVKESLAGRAHLFTLYGLSLNEILTAYPTLSLATILFRGGFPLLYTQEAVLPVPYLNDYILSFVEKDIARQAGGIEKIPEFHTALRLLATRTGQFLNFSALAAQAGIDQKTLLAWTLLLQRNDIVRLVPSFSSNLSKRITKMQKLYFVDTGLCARLQGHGDQIPLWNSPQIGHLFETLVFSEVLKTKNNFSKEWAVFTWRTKDQAEIDLVIQSDQHFLLIEAKLAIHGAKPFTIDPEGKKVFPSSTQKIVVTAGGDTISKLDHETKAVPIQKLAWFLLNEWE